MKKIFKNNIKTKSFIYDLDQDVSISYSEINIINKKFSKILKKKKQLVILLAENSIDFIITYYCLIQNNFLVILINEKISKSNIRNLIKKFKPNFISYSENYRFKYLKKKCFKFRKYSFFSLNNKDQNIHKDICLLLKTSGSTGESKFVKLTYKNIISNTRKISNFLNINKKDITITTLPPEYSYGLSIINSHIFSGSSIIMNKKSIIEKKFWEIVEQHKVNSFGGVPYTYELLKKIRFENNLKKIRSLKYITQAGGKLSIQLNRYINKISKKYKFRFYVMYGATEASPRMSIMLSKDNFKLGSIGKALPGCSFLIKKKK